MFFQQLIGSEMFEIIVLIADYPWYSLFKATPTIPHVDSVSYVCSWLWSELSGSSHIGRWRLVNYIIKNKHSIHLDSMHCPKMQEKYSIGMLDLSFALKNNC